MRRILLFLAAFCSQLTIPLIAIGQPEQLDIQIPVVDMRDFYQPEKREQFIETIYQALSRIGFFAVRNTGIDSTLIKEAYCQAETFFKQDAEYKAKSSAKETSGQRGFVPGEVAKGKRVKDCKEFYHIGRDLSDAEHKRQGTAKNVWPEQAGFKEAMVTLYDELDQYVVPLQEAIVEAINRHTSTKLPLHFLNEMTKEGNTLLRALYYPALEKEQIASATEPLYWAAAHTDIDLLAILPYATEKGLSTAT